MLVNPVVVAGDGSRADIHARADFGIPQIGQVHGLRSPPHARLLHLDEIADVHAFFKMVAHAETRVRPGLNAPLQL